LDDLLYIKTNIKEIRRASLVYEQSIYLAELEGNIICSAEIKLACVNAKMQPCVLPSILKQMENA
jgi:acyl-CoA thioester hydrolase